MSINYLVIANTKFEHKGIHKYRRVVGERNKRFIIDYFLINRDKWRLMKDVKWIRQAEISGDHYIVKMVLAMRKGNKKDKRKKPK